MKRLPRSRYWDFRICGLKVYRIQICVAKIHREDGETDYAHVYKFPTGKIRECRKKYKSADVAQDALDTQADGKGWRYSGRNANVAVLEMIGDELEETVPVLN